MSETRDRGVTVVCVTYNHEAYIAQALDSFLAQEADFPVQIFVADDCSTDQTRQIISHYCERYPDSIRAFFPDENRGAERNLIAMCQEAQTTYVALCDGDDYWIDNRKLKKQFDYMEQHAEMRACFHDTEIVMEDGCEWFLINDYNNTPDGTARWCSGDKRFRKQDSYTIADYIPCGFVHSSSMFFRWDDEVVIPDWFYDHILGDYTLWCLQIGLGQFGYIDEVMSVYRRHAGGGYIFNSREEFWGLTKPDWIRIDADLKDYFTKLGAPADYLELFDARQKSDLVKLLRYARSSGVDLDSYNNFLLEYQELIETHLGVKLSKPPFNAFTGHINIYMVNSALDRVRFMSKLKHTAQRIKR